MPNAEFIVKMAYLLGCKHASIDNANVLEDKLKELANPKSSNKEDTYGVASDTMRNFKEKRESESGAPFGEKHQLAINPEWSGP